MELCKFELIYVFNTVYKNINRILVITGDTSEFTGRLKKLKSIDFSIEGIPYYYNSTKRIFYV
jgi:hypothetical protein